MAQAIEYWSWSQRLKYNGSGLRSCLNFSGYDCCCFNKQRCRLRRLFTFISIRFWYLHFHHTQIMMTDRILHSSAQKIVLPATKESAAAYRLNRAEIIGNGCFCFWRAANGSLNENRFHASIFKTVNWYGPSTNHRFHVNAYNIWLRKGYPLRWFNSG